MRSLRSRWTMAALRFVLLASTCAARAQSSGSADPAPKGYEPLVKRGVEEMSINNYPEARSLFLQAEQLFPNARVFRALGMVEYELRNYVAALNYLERALGSEVRPLDREKRAQVDKLRNEAQSFVARIRLSVRPAHAALELDDVPTSHHSGTSLLLQMGSHVLEVSAPGHQPARRTLNVTGGEERELTIQLVPEASAVAAQSEGETVVPHKTVVPLQAAAQSASVRDDDAPPLRRKWWVWTTLGLVVAGAAAGTAIALTSRHQDTQPGSGGSAMSTLKGPTE